MFSGGKVLENLDEAEREGETHEYTTGYSELIEVSPILFLQIEEHNDKKEKYHHSSCVDENLDYTNEECIETDEDGR